MPGPVTTIANLESEVILKCENRTSDTARADIWIRDAILEISGNPDYRDDFDDLEILGLLTNLTGGAIGVSVQEYPFSNFLPSPGGTTIYNLSTLDVMLWIDFPTNNIRRKLNPSHYQEADKIVTYPSIPTSWYRFADTLGFDPPPNQNYQVQCRVLQRHPFVDFFNAVGNLNTTTVLLPLEWNEIIEWAAAMRGFMELLEFDRAAQLRNMLYGDPKHPDKVGLISSVKKRRSREAWREQQPLRPIVQGSTWGSS